ncbi:BatD family protein [Candidatus Margulisiibacteriota bacterium]
MWKKTGSFLIVVLMFVTLMLADTVVINTAVNKKSVPINGTFSLTLSVDGSKNISGISLPALKDFTVLGQSSSTQIQIINGRQSSTKAYIYTLRPKKQGAAKIPALNFKHGGDTFKTDPIEIMVTAFVTPNTRASRSSRRGSIASLFDDNFFRDDFFTRRVQRSSIPQQEVTAEYSPRKRYLYLGEKTLLDFKLYYERQFRDGPVASFPELPGFVANGSSPQLKELAPRQVQRNGKQFRVISFARPIYASSPGTKTLPSIQVQYVDNVFEGVKTIATKPVKVYVKQLPVPQPEIFSGAVGSFKLEVEFNPKSNVKENGSIPLIVKLTGSGNADMVNDLGLENTDRVQWYLDSINTKGSKGLTVKKTFKYFLAVREAGEVQLPEIKFCYFNPQTEKYDYAVYALAPFSVLEREGAADEIRLERSTKPIDIKDGALEIRFSKKLFAGVGRTLLKVGVLAAGVILLFWLVVSIMRLRTAPLRRAQKKLVGLAKAKALSDQDFINEAYLILVDIVRFKYQLALKGMTRATIKAKVSDSQTADFIIDLVSRHEEFKYAGIELTADDKKAIIDSIRKI